MSIMGKYVGHADIIGRILIIRWKGLVAAPGQHGTVGQHIVQLRFASDYLQLIKHKRQALDGPLTMNLALPLHYTPNMGFTLIRVLAKGLVNVHR